MTKLRTNSVGAMNVMAPLLLPDVILASLVGNVYKVADEKGIETLLKRLLWTLYAGFCCVPLFGVDTIARVVVIFPEMHLITLAFILVIAGCQGNKLSELPKWTWMAEQKK